MLDRGLTRGFAPAVEREAAGARAGTDGRRDLRDLPTFTIDPASARDFDDAISAQELADWALAGVGAHRRRLRTRAGRVGRRSRGLAASDQRVRTGRHGADAAARAVQRRLLAGARSRAPGGHGGDGAARRRRAPGGLPSATDPLRRSAWTMTASIASSPEPSRRWSRGRAAGRGSRGCAAALQRAQRADAGALVVESAEPEFEFDEEGHVVAMSRVPQTESHRLIEHLMIAANEQVARLLEPAAGTRALPRARASGAAGRAAPGRPARLPRRGHVAPARAHEPPAGGRRGGGDVAPGRRPRAAVRARAARR